MIRLEDIKIIVCGFLFLWVAFSVAEAKQINCKKHPIYCQIKKNSPRINSKEAMHLSNVIYKVSRKHHLPTRIFVAILAQESGYRLEAQGCHKGLVKEVSPRALDIIEKAKLEHHTPVIPLKEKYRIREVKVCADFGIGQIWYKTARGFGFDINKLTVDLDYSVEAAAVVLADFQKRFSAREVDWWTRYNCGSRSTTKRDTCQIYKKLVERYF